VADHQAEVQAGLRRAELERVAAETRAREEQARTVVEQARTREALGRVSAERRARQRLLALAGAVLVFLLVVVVAWEWQQRRVAASARQDQTDREALGVLETARGQLEEGWQAQDPTKLTEARAEADRATDIVRSGGARDSVEQQVATFRTEATERLEREKKNRDLLTALVDIATPHETKTYTDRSGQMMALAEPSVEEQYSAAFRRRWPDVDIDKHAESAVVARLQEEPEVVLQGVIAGLDGWMLERWKNRPEAEWRRLLGLVERLDHSEQRRQLRALLIGSMRPRAEDVAGLLGGRPPWIALWELGRGRDWQHLRQLRSQMNAAAEPVLTVLLLAQASSGVGDMVGAEEVLHQALARRPDAVALLDALGKLLERQGRLLEAIGCYRAARAKKSGLGVSLGRSLGQARQWTEGEAILRDLIRQQPKNPEIRFYLGNSLYGQGKPVEAACREAIALKPDYAEAYYNLGIVLSKQGRFTESLAAYLRGHELGSKQPLWRYPSLQWGREAEHLVELEKKLPAILQGEVSPANPDDAITLAWMCQQFKKRHVAAARLYADAFAADSKLAADLNAQHRYNAACSALLAAAGQGEDARLLPDKVTTMFRRWALGWLRDDLKGYAKLAEPDKPAVNKLLQQRLTHWRNGPDLASVRDPQALDRLPDNERAAWQALWRDVDELAKRVAK
jgi:tetratricopeptide (TPR) repeat protein